MPPLDSAAGPDDQLLPAQNAPDPWSVVGTRPLAQPQPETPAPSASREWDVVDQKPLTQAAPTAPPTWAQPGENEKPPEWHEQPQPLGTAAQPYEPLDPAEYGSWLKSAPKGSVVRFPSGSTWTKPYDQPPEPPSVGGVALRAAERGLVPATTGLAGAGIGAEAGAAAGALFGPAAPVAIPAGAILGGLAGAVGGGWAGEKAQELILKQLPDWAVHALGQLPKDQQADIAAHSIAALAGTFIPNAAFFSPLAAERAAVPYAENVLSRLMQHPATHRLIPATIMAGQEAGGELAEGEPPSPTKIAVAGAAGAAMQRPTALGERVLGAGTAALARLRGTAAPAAERAAQQPATTVNNEQQPSGETAEAAVSQGAAGAPGAPGQTPTRLALPAPEVVYGPGSPWTSTGTGMIPGTPGFVMHRGAGAEALSALEAEAAQTARAAEPSGAPAEPPVGAGAPEGAARPAGTAAPLPEAAQAEAALAKEAQTPGPLQPVPEAALTPGAPPLRDYAAEYEANRARASRAEMAPAEARQPISTAPIHETTELAFVPSTGAAVPIQYAIADARDLVTSHHDDLSPNTEYPQALQPRSRERAETEAQLAGILNGDPRDPEATFRPELLGENPDAANGAPIVGPEGYVESGNARTMAIRRAYDRGLPQAEQYQNYLRAQGYPIENTEQPVLVRINRANMDMPQREQLARDLNVPPQATMSATDRAMADAQQINPEMLGAYRGGDVFSAQNKPFWRGILDRIAKPAELPALTNPEGGLSPAGQARIRSAVLAKAYGDPDIVAALTEDPDSNIKAIGNALTDAAPRWAQLRQAVAEGHISKTYDQTSPLLEAVRLVSHARSEGRNVAEFMRQGGLFGEGVSPETESIMRWMLGDPEWSRRFGREKIADALDEYADSVLRPLRLGEVRAAPMQLVGNAREVAHGAAGDLFASPLGQPGGAGGFREGAGEGRPETQGPEVAAPRVGTSAEEPRATRPGLTLEHPAYHGSPFKFDQFTLDHIGEGEGAQAYGHGLYFAGERKVAEFYRSKLATGEEFSALTSDENSVIPDWLRNDIARQGPATARANVENAIENFQRRVVEDENEAKVSTQPWLAQGRIPGLRRIVDALQKLRDSGDFTSRKGGRLYHVELAPKEDEYLDWDRPFAEQSPAVKAALYAAVGGREAIERKMALRRAIFAQYQPEIDRLRTELESLRGPEGRTAATNRYSELVEQRNDNADRAALLSPLEGFLARAEQGTTRRDTGADLYHAMREEWRQGDVRNRTGSGAEQASENLLNAGIRGIRYADQGSRSRTNPATYSGDMTGQQRQGLEVLNNAGQPSRWERDPRTLLRVLIENFTHSAEARAKGNPHILPTVDDNLAALKSLDPEKIIPPTQSHNYVIFDPGDITIKHLEEEKARGAQGGSSAGAGAYRNTRDDYLAYRANTAFAETPEGAHASARGYVRQRGAETGNEHIAVYDPQWAGITHVGTNDLPDRVSFATEGLDGRLADPNAGLTIHHNHPGDAALSGTDIAALAHPGVHQVVAHAHGEDVFAARLTPETQAAIANLPPRLHGDVGLSLAYQKANSIVRTALQMQTLADKISPAEFDDLQADLVNRALDAAGIIDYVGTRAPSELPERVRRSIIGRAAREAADSAGVNLKLQPPTDGEIRARLDRSTLVSRPDEAMAGISGIAPERGPERPAGEAAPAGERAGIGAPAEGAEALVGRGARGLAEEPSDAEIATRLREPGGGEPPEEPPRPPPTGGAPPGGGPPRPDSSAFLKRTMATDETTGFGRLRQRVNDFLHDRPATRFRAYWQDELAEAARVQKGLQANGYTPARISPVASARFARNYRSTVRMVWTKNQGRYDPVRGMVVPIDGSKSGQAIIDQLRHDREFGGRKAQDDFAAWYIANRSEKLMSEGRERLVTRSDIDTFKNIDQHYQRADGSNLFHQVKGDLSEFNSRLLDLLEASGYINREGRSLWEHEFYVPYYRALAPDLDVPGRPRGGTRSGMVGPPIRRLEGGAEKINNVYENMFLNTEALVGRAMDMIARREMRTMLLFNTDALTPMSKEARAPYGDPIIQDHLRAIGLDPTKLSDAAKEAAKEVWGALRNREPDVYTVFDYGKANHYRVNDPLMLKALTAAGSETTSGVMKLLTTPARVLRQAVVLDPAFAAAHNLRMAMHAWNLTGVNPIASFAGALRNLKSLEPDAVKLMTAGALSGKYDAGYSQAMRREFYSEGYQNSLLDTPLKAARFVRDWGEQLIQAADVGPRVAVYRKALAEGATDAEAMDRARDLLDFSTHGYGAAAMFLAQTVPFMNARWQGLSRTYRGFTGTDRNAILARTALVTAASLALWYENKDDPEYQRKPDWDRQYAMQIKVAPGTWFRLPAFYELGALGYTLPTMLADYFYGESSTRQLASAAGSMFLNVFRFNPIPVAIRPIEDVIRNQDSYTGAPIVNQREQDLLPDQRFGPSDSASIVAMAHAYNSQVPQALQVAPAMLQHLINGYLAGWGTYVTLAADYLGNEAGILPAKSAPAEMPMVGRFIHEEPSPSNRLLGDFYDLRTQTENVGNSIKTARNHGDAALAQQLQAAHPEWTPPLQSQFKTAGDALSKSRGQWQNAEMNPALTREQKTEARTKYYQQRDQLLDRLEPWMRQIEGLPARP